MQLGLEDNLVRDLRFQSARAIVGPALGQVQLEVDRQMHRLGRKRQAHAHLAVGDLAGRAGVLALHADRVPPLFDEARIVDDPRLHGLLLRHLAKRVLDRLVSNSVVIPRRVADEMQQPIMRCLRQRGIRARLQRKRLDALALCTSEQSHRIDREACTAFLVAQHRADPSQKPFYPTLRTGFEFFDHSQHGTHPGDLGQESEAVVLKASRRST